MSNRREEFHYILVDILGTRGQPKSRVYFQPPETIKLKYPCIIYNRSAIDTKHADDKLYNHRRRYTVTVIDPDPDSEILEKILNLPLCRFDRHYTADNLNHDVFNVYY